MTLHAIVFNPASGRRPGEALARQVADVFAADGHATRLLPTQGPGHASDMAEVLLREMGPEPVDLIALGGDGTLNEVLVGASRAGALQGARSSLRLAALPGGTTNVVCRSLGLPGDPLQAARALRAGAERLLDVGTCRVHAQERPFLLACGVGFDAELLLRVSPRMKRLFGQGAYQAAAFLHAGDRRRGLMVEIERADGSRESVACASLVVGASELYAGILRLSREARPDDGLLEVALFSSTRLWPLVRAAWCAGRSSFAEAPGVRVVQALSLRASALVEVPVHVDAESAGHLPASIGIRPGALRMRVG